MEENRISLYRGLALIKTTEKRMDDLLFSGKFIATRVGVENQAEGEPLEDCIGNIKKNYQSYMDLYNQLKSIKIKISKANAGIEENTPVKTILVDGKAMTIAELIIENQVKSYLESFCQTLKNQYSMAVSNCDKHNTKLLQKQEELLSTMVGSNKNGLSKEDIERYTKVFQEGHEQKLVDPLDLKKKIEEIEKELNKIETVFDAALSEANATTFISI